MKQLIIIIFTLLLTFNIAAQKKDTATSGNPVFPGWYADPEAAVFNNEYWIYPTYSAKYEEQVFFNAFSSPDLVHWTKHDKILDTANVKWAKRAVWAPAIIEKDKKYFLFLARMIFKMISSTAALALPFQISPKDLLKIILASR